MKRTSFYCTLASILSLMFYLMFQPAFADMITPALGYSTHTVTASNCDRCTVGDHGVTVAVKFHANDDMCTVAFLSPTKLVGTRLHAGPGSSFAASNDTGKRIARYLALMQPSYRSPPVFAYGVNRTDKLLKWRLTKA